MSHPKAIMLAHCGGRAIALGDRIREIPGEVEHAVGHMPLIGYLAFGEQGCSVPGIPTHADLSLVRARARLGRVDVADARPAGG